MNKVIPSLVFLFFKWRFKRYAARMNPLAGYPFIVFVNFTLDTVYKHGGLKAVKTAVAGWDDNYSANLKKASGDFESGARFNLVSVESEKFNGKFDYAFYTLAELLENISGLINPEQVLVNGREANAGTWLRPGDRVTIKTIRKEAGKK